MVIDGSCISIVLKLLYYFGCVFYLSLVIGQCIGLEPMLHKFLGQRWQHLVKTCIGSSQEKIEAFVQREIRLANSSSLRRHPSQQVVPKIEQYTNFNGGGQKLLQEAGIATEVVTLAASVIVLTKTGTINKRPRLIGITRRLP